MSDSLPEGNAAPESYRILAQIKDVLENDENGLEVVQQAFADEFERARQEIAERSESFEKLKEIRLAFLGDKGGFTLANKQMRDLRKEHKAEVGKLMGQARGRLSKALEARTQELEEERDARILVEEAVDVTAASARRQLGGRHPLNIL